MKRNKIAVIGLGNYLLSDEGAGMHTIELLRQKYLEENVDLIDAGTPGMNLLHQFEERKKIIFIDSGNLGLQPGEFKRFKPENVRTLKKYKGYSLHEFDLIKFLNYVSEIDKKFTNTDVVIYGIQVAEIKMSESLSPIVKKRINVLTDEIIEEIKEFSESQDA